MIQISVLLSDDKLRWLELFFRSNANGGEFMCDYMTPRIVSAVRSVLLRFTDDEFFAFLSVLKFRNLTANVCDRRVVLSFLQEVLIYNKALQAKVDALSDMEITALVIVCNGYWKGRGFIKKRNLCSVDPLVFRSYMDLVRRELDGRHDSADQGVAGEGSGTQEEAGAV